MGDKPPFLETDNDDFFKSINSEQGTSPCSSTSDKAIIARSIVWPFAPLKASSPR